MNLKEYLIAPELDGFYKFDPKLNIAVLASGKGSNFQNLLKLSKKEELDINIVKLITNNKDADCIDKAIKGGISYEVISDKDYENKIDFENELINVIKKQNVEIIVLAGWMKILSAKFVNTFKNKIINIHPSLLPSFKGNKAIEKAYSENVLITGCSVHFVVPAVDSGKLIIQGALPIIKGETIKELKLRIHELEHIILPLGVSEAGRIVRNGLMDKSF